MRSAAFISKDGPGAKGSVIVTAKWIVRGVLVCVVLAAGVKPALAQEAANDTPKVDLSIGYQYLKVKGAEKGLGDGAYVEANMALNRHFGVVLQASSNFGLEDLSATTGMVGTRVTSRGSRVNVYAQALGGLFRAACCRTSETDFAAQGGVGLVVKATESASFKIGGDYIRVFDTFGGDLYRVTAGLAFSLGRK
jgi:hypothetical protein